MSKAERHELDRASELSNKGRHDEAIAKLEILLTSADPEVHDLALNYPVVRRQGRIDEAEETYKRALAALKSDAPELKVITMRNLAYLYWSTGREDRAREVLGRLPDCDDDFLEFMNGLLKPYIEPEIPL